MLTDGGNNDGAAHAHTRAGSAADCRGARTDNARVTLCGQVFGSLVKEAPGLCAGLCKNEATALVNYYDWSNATANRDSDVGYVLKFPGHPGGGAPMEPYCDGCDLSSVGHYVTYRCGGNATDIPGIRKEGACSSESDAGGAGATCNLVKVGAGAELYKCGIHYEYK